MSGVGQKIVVKSTLFGSFLPQTPLFFPITVSHLIFFGDGGIEIGETPPSTKDYFIGFNLDTKVGL